MKIMIITSLLLLSLGGCSSVIPSNDLTSTTTTPAVITTANIMHSPSSVLAKSDYSSFSIPLYKTEQENMSFSFQLIGSSDFLH